MQNLKNEACHIVIHSPAHSEAVQHRLFELGFSWGGHNTTKPEYIERASLQINTHTPNWITQSSRTKPDPSWTDRPIHVITLDDLYSDKFTGPKSIIVPLNDSYSAKVSKEGISVSVNGVKQTDLSYPLSVLDLLVEAKEKVGAGGELRDKVCHLITRNENHVKAALDRLFELGFSWGSGTEKYRCLYARNLSWNFLGKNSISYGDGKPPCPSSVLVTLDDLYGPKFTGVSEVEVDLGDVSYPDALVTKDSVKIGCQSFPISVLDALLAARKEVTEG